MFALLEKRTKWKEMVKAAKKPGAMKELRDGGGVDDFVLGLVPKLAEHSGGATDREENDRQKTRQGARRAEFPPRLSPRQGPHLGEARAGPLGRRRRRRRRRVHRETRSCRGPRGSAWTPGSSARASTRSWRSERSGGADSGGVARGPDEQAVLAPER